MNEINKCIEIGKKKNELAYLIQIYTIYNIHININTVFN